MGLQAAADWWVICYLDVKDDEDDDDDEDGILAGLRAGDDDSSEEENDSEDEAVLAQALKVHTPLPAQLAYLRCHCTRLARSLVTIMLLLNKSHYSTRFADVVYLHVIPPDSADRTFELYQSGTAAVLVLPHDEP